MGIHAYSEACDLEVMRLAGTKLMDTVLLLGTSTATQYHHKLDKVHTIRLGEPSPIGAIIPQNWDLQYR